MSEIVHDIQEEMKQSGYEVRAVSITRLQETQEAVGKLVRQGLLNKRLCENWHFYKEPNTELPRAKTIIIAALPRPITRIRFRWQGSDYPAEIAPNYIFKEDESRFEAGINNVLAKAGYRMTKARLPLKTLAVRSGLAEYGKNNISYIPGIGSFYRLVAFYSDCPCENYIWQEPRVMKICENCLLCYENCPSGSITADRFLIHAEKCLGFLNEKEPDTPYWAKLQPCWPNALVGCMSCQIVCPVNKPYLSNIVEGTCFSEEETDQILHSTPLEKLNVDTRQKLGIPDGVYPLLAVNLKALIEKRNKTTAG